MTRTSFLFTPLFLWMTTSSAFVPQRRSFASKTTSIKYQFSPDNSSESDRPLRRLTPDCVWVKETDEFRAIECAEGEQCSLEEIKSLIVALQDSKEENTYDNDSTIAQGRDDVLRMLQLQQELLRLRNRLPDNDYASGIKRGEDEEWKGHWFEDYLHHDEPRRPYPGHHH